MPDTLEENLRKIQTEYWEKARAEIFKRLDKDVYSSWFEDMKVLGGDDSSIILGVMGEFASIWVRDNFLDIIATELSLVAGRSISVEIKSVDMPEYAKSIEVEPVKKKVDKVYEEPVDLPASIIHKNSFDTFVVGDSNNFAHAAALAVSQSLGTAYNPLFIYGSTGLGKTHLMHAIAQFVLNNNRRAKIAYLSSESFLNEYIEELSSNNLSNFRKRYRNIDILLIDDVQFFAKKDKFQQEFFHTFNDLFNNGKQIVLSCDKPINEVADIEQRLVSRFGWGVSAEIQAPDYETRLAILVKKLSARKDKVAIAPEILDLLATKFTKSIRRMEGALTNLISYALLLQAPLTLQKAQEILADTFAQEEDNAQIDIEQIQRKTSEYYKIDLAEMTSKRRPANIAQARQVAMYLSRKLTSHSLQEIGKRFGGRDHGTVMHAIRVVEHSYENDDSLKRSIDYLMKSLSL